MIHLSQATSKSLTEAMDSEWSKPRKGCIHIDGQGLVQTFYVSPSRELGEDPLLAHSYAEHTERLVEWNTEQLLQLLQNLVSSRAGESLKSKTRLLPATNGQNGSSRNPIEEVTELVKMPDYMARPVHQIDCIDVGDQVKGQLKAFVAAIAATYNRNAFHNFEHAVRRFAPPFVENHSCLTFVRPLLVLVSCFDECQQDAQTDRQGTRGPYPERGGRGTSPCQYVRY